MLSLKTVMDKRFWERTCWLGTALSIGNLISKLAAVALTCGKRPWFSYDVAFLTSEGQLL